MLLSTKAVAVWLTLATCADAWVVPKTAGRTSTVSTALFASSTNSTKVVDLPDYGKTTVEVDKIKLEKKKPSKWTRKDLFGSTLVDQTLEEMEQDEDFQRTQSQYEKLGAAGVTKEERLQRRRALDGLGVKPFAEFLQEQLVGPASSESSEESTSYTISRKTPTVLQINAGLYCNQACGHCHVESSPLRKEMMDMDVAARCLEILKNTPSITTLDITGGAPELNRNFRYLVSMARSMRPDLDIIDRCNLTVLQEPGQEDLVDFLKANRVHVIASLPCYSADNVDQQRGNGVFDRSVAALLALNEAGYAKDPSLNLDLVYNPLGAFLPPEQQALEQQYKKQLAENFDILFNQLFTMTNMPVKRFADFLHRRDELQGYLELLVRNFNPSTVESLMCLDMVSVGWDGKIFDCDFNQQLGYGIGVDDIHKGGLTVFDIESLTDLMDTSIRTDNHCFGCTAGMGSS